MWPNRRELCLAHKMKKRTNSTNIEATYIFFVCVFWFIGVYKNQQEGIDLTEFYIPSLIP